MTHCTAAPLFGNASDQHILHILQDDWERFSLVAFLKMGLPQVWEAAVQEFDLLLSLWWRDKGQDSIAPLLPLFDLLFDRACSGDVKDTIIRLEFMEQTLGTGLPIIDRMKRRAQVQKEWLALSPIERERQAYQAWKRDFHDGKLETKPQPILPSGKRRRRKR